MSIRVLYIALNLILCQYALAQDHILIKGRVKDKASGVLISNVNIKLKNYPVGTITSKEGTFNILVKELPVIIEVSHIGYQSEIIEITDPFEEEIFITLEKKTQELDEVVISGSKVETVYKDDVYSVLDYEFLNDDILLLVYRNSFSNELVILNTSNDTIAKFNSTNIKPRSLFKDCLGVVHVLCKDTAYQINYQDHRIELIYPTPIDEFANLIYPCVAQLNDKFYIKFYSYNNLVIEYHYVKKGENQLHLLKRIVDSVKTDLINSNPYIRSLFNLTVVEGKEDRVLNMGGYVPMQDQIQLLKGLRNSQIEAHYLGSIVLTPVFAPLVKIRDTIAILNHPADQIEFYSSSDSLIRKIPISFHKENDWVKDILVDESSFNVYCVFLHSGVYVIRELNIQTGKPDNSTNIYFPFVKAIKIRDGYVYYLYKRAGEWDNSKLFRQKLN